MLLTKKCKAMPQVSFRWPLELPTLVIYVWCDTRTEIMAANFVPTPLSLSTGSFACISGMRGGLAGVLCLRERS